MDELPCLVLVVNGVIQARRYHEFGVTDVYNVVSPIISKMMTHISDLRGFVQYMRVNTSSKHVLIMPPTDMTCDRVPASIRSLGGKSHVILGCKECQDGDERCRGVYNVYIMNLGWMAIGMTQSIDTCMTSTLTNMVECMQKMHPSISKEIFNDFYGEMRTVSVANTKNEAIKSSINDIIDVNRRITLPVLEPVDGDRAMSSLSGKLCYVLGTNASHTYVIINDMSS